MKQNGEYERDLRNRAARNLLVNHTHICSSVQSYIPTKAIVFPEETAHILKKIIKILP